MSRPRVLVLGRPMNLVAEALSRHVDVVTTALDDPALDAASVRGMAFCHGSRPLTECMMERLPALEIIANFGVGYDGVDTEAAARRGIVVTNTPDVLTEEVADLTLGLLLATVRQLPQADRFVREGGWLKGAFPFSATLRTRRVGIVGLGRIGKAVARRLEAFAVPIAYHGRNRQADVPYRYYPDLIAMAADVDTLVCVAPGGAATRGLIGEAVFRALGRDGIFVNVGRGSVVDEPALIAALQAGVIHSAGLDVFADEPRVPDALIALPNVVLLPHIGSATHHTRAAMGQLQADNLIHWFEGRGPLTPVPETPWPRP